MKINNGNSIKPLTQTGATEGVARSARTDKTAASESQPSGDNVKITSLSSQLQALESSLENTPVVDTARVDAIKQAISEGRLKVNPEVVADRLIATVKDLVLPAK